MEDCSIDDDDDNNNEFGGLAQSEERNVSNVEAPGSNIVEHIN